MPGIAEKSKSPRSTIVVEVVDHQTFAKWAREHSKLTTIVGATKKIQIRDLDISRAYKDA